MFLERRQQILHRNVRLVLLLVLVYGCSPIPTPVDPSIAGVQYVQDASFAGMADVYTASGGAVLGYVKYETAGAKRALVYLHGIESHAGWFAQAATLLRDRGYDVYCLDRRGSGINRENRGFVSGHVDSYKTLLADLSAFIQPLRNRYDSVFLVGLSWGGKLALGYGLTHPEDIGGLVLITPGIRALVDVSLFTKFKILLFSRTQPTEPIASPIRPEMFTTTPRNLDFINRDPLRLKYGTARFYWESHRLDGYIDDRISNLRLPVELFLAGRDRIIDNEGVRRVLEQGAQDQLEIVTYEDQTHSLQLDATERLVQHIDNWLRRHQ
ncbi:MAG TPA: alpha/beta fold hydrolase [Candidatus Binatia bacterium]|nr:alpha/beta fold hydrolase [Candidatus Binatia bacterium]